MRTGLPLSQAILRTMVPTARSSVNSRTALRTDGISQSRRSQDTLLTPVDYFPERVAKRPCSSFSKGDLSAAAPAVAWFVPEDTRSGEKRRPATDGRWCAQASIVYGVRWRLGYETPIARNFGDQL